jgi:D-serine deaminase-like pyridoxal phosphate-dependent protein
MGPKNLQVPFERILAAAKNVTSPSMFVDQVAFDNNVQSIAESVAGSPITIRVATKSLRVPDLIKRVQNFAPSIFKGLMCYSAQEAKLLAEKGLDDLLIAYPKLLDEDLQILVQLHNQGTQVSLVVDSEEGCAKLEAVANRLKTTKPFPVVFELDVSESVGGFWIGARRSPLRQPGDVLHLIDACKQRHPLLKYHGIMAYEGQVSSTTDAKLLEKLMRHWQARRVEKKRAELFSELSRQNFQPDLFNGGGTGCLHWARHEKALTEIAVGSGFYFPHLFDGSSTLYLQPAIYFVLPRCRSPKGGNWATYQGGGFIASGPMGKNRQPQIVWPEGTTLSALEGFGEVQTPVKFKAGTSAPERIILRPAKAGEIAERANEIHFINENGTATPMRTYRGWGGCFN